MDEVKERPCLLCYFVAVIKYQEQGTLEEEFIWVYGSRRRVHSEGGGMVEEARAGS